MSCHVHSMWGSSCSIDSGYDKWGCRSLQIGCNKFKKAELQDYQRRHLCAKSIYRFWRIRESNGFDSINVFNLVFLKKNLSDKSCLEKHCGL